MGWRDEPVYQAEVSECGLACLVQIANAFGENVGLAELRRKVQVSTRGLNFSDLIEIAPSLGLRLRAVNVQPDSIGALRLPAVLHWQFNHFVVLERVGRSKVTIVDPSRGRIAIARSSFAESFTGMALEAMPQGEASPSLVKSKSNLLRAMLEIPGVRTSLAWLLFFSLFLEAVSLITPLYSKIILDSADTGTMFGQSWAAKITFAFALLVLAAGVTNYGRGLLTSRLGVELNRQMSETLFGHILKLPITYFQKRHLGDITAAFDSVGAFQRTLTSAFISGLIDGVMAIVTLALMIWINAKLAIVPIVVTCIYVCFRALRNSAHKNSIQEQIQRTAEQASSLFESIRGIQSLKIFQKEGARLSAWSGLLARTSNQILKSQSFPVQYQAMSVALIGIQSIVVIYLGVGQIEAGVSTVGGLFAFVAYVAQFTQKSTSLIERAVDISILGVHKNRLSDVYSEPAENFAPGDGGGVSGPSYTVELKDLTFSYGYGLPPVVASLNIKVEAGEFVVITGPSGCGKTTVMKIMQGLLLPTVGSVYVNEKLLEEIGVSAWRSVTSAVMQEDSLFSGTIRDNITFFSPVPDEEQLASVCSLCRIDEFVNRFPLGLDTQVGDMGGLLSGGEKQRVLLARALYKRPSVLFMDEATSHLDSETEVFVSRAISSLKITRIMIAHRQETIRTADRVIVI